MTAPEGLECHITIDPTETSPRWLDLTPWLLLGGETPVTISRGRTDELSQVDTGNCTFYLDNRDGTWTPDRDTSPQAGILATDKEVQLYYPNESINLLMDPDNDKKRQSSTFEVDTTTGYWTGFVGLAATSRSNDQAWQGSWALKIEHNGDAGMPVAGTIPGHWVIGKTYTWSCYVYHPSTNSTGCRQTRINSFDFSGFADSGSATDVWKRVSVTFTLTSSWTRTTGVQLFMGVVGSNAQAGDVVYVDGIMVNEGSVAAPFSTSTTDTHNYRFTGNIQSARVQWPGGSEDCRTQVVLADRQGAWSRQEFLNIGTEQCRLPDPFNATTPVVVYPLGDDSKSSTATDISKATTDNPAAVKKKNGNGGGSLNAGRRACELGVDGPVGGDGAAEFYSTGTGGVNYTYLQVDWESDPYGSLGWAYNRTIAIAFRLDAPAEGTSTINAGSLIALVGRTGWSLEISADTDGHIHFAGKAGSSVVHELEANSQSWADDIWHVAMMRINDQQITAYLDGWFIGTVSPSAGTYFWKPGNHRLYIGGRPGETGIRGRLALATVHNGLWDINNHWWDTKNAILTGLSAGDFDIEVIEADADTSDDRIHRYLDWIEYPFLPLDRRDVWAGKEQTISHIGPMSAWAAMQTVNETEGGWLYMDRRGRLAFRDRHNQLNRAVEFTLDQLSVGKDTEFSIDNELFCNIFECTSEVAGSLVARNEDSITLHGEYPRSGEIATSDRQSVRQRANWMVRRFGREPQARMPDVTVDLTSLDATTVTSLQDFELGQRFRVNGLDADTAPGTTVTVVLDGYVETISIHRWEMRLTTSPVSIRTVIQLGDATYGKLDDANYLAN